MSDEPDITRLITEATEKIRRDAYAKGWRDAVAALQKAAEGIADGTTAEDAGGLFEGNFFGGTAAAVSGLTEGSTPFYVYQAIKKRSGMTGSEVVEAVQTGGHNVAEGNIRTSIARLKGKGLIVARHNKWFART